MPTDPLEHYRASAAVPGATPWRQAPFVVVDLETTGLNARRHEIISFAAVPIVHARVQPGLVTALLVRPERPSDAAATRIHGLRPADLASAPSLGEALPTIAAALAGRVLVAHAAWIERTFLVPALATEGLKLRGPVLDTMALGRHVLRLRGLPPSQASELSDLARMLGLPVHRPHHADGDALTTAQVFLAIATALEAEGGVTVGRLAAIARRPTRTGWMNLRRWR